MLKSHTKNILDILGRSPIHPFPARMAPGIALAALGDNEPPLRVLDPMAGSGTVLAVARSKGHRAFGVDLDPLAVLLAKVWTRTVDAEDVIDKAVEVLHRAKETMRLRSAGLAYPPESDIETRAFIRYWFDEHARRQLAALSIAIRRVRHKPTRDVLWCGFSRLIITKQAGASLAMDLSHSRPHRKFVRAPVNPFDRFIVAVQSVVSNCPQQQSERVGPVSVVKHGDARSLDFQKDSMDLVITSPPYLNAIDYMRCSKFSLVWMGHTIGEIRQIRKESVGTEASSGDAMEASWVRSLLKELQLRPALAYRDQALLATYAWDIDLSVAQVSRVLRPNGRAVYVVGDSMIRGTFVRNSAIVIAAAEKHGLSLKSRVSRSLPDNRRYLPPPSRGAGKATMDSRMRREVVLSFSKRPVSS